MSELIDRLTESWDVVATLGGILATGFGVGHFIGHWRGKKKGPKAEKIEAAEKQAREAEKRAKIADDQAAQARGRAVQMSNEVQTYQSLRAALLGRDTDLWTLHPPVQYEGYNQDVNDPGLHVICVMNLKGGVGKTTVATNLAAYFDQRLGKRTLLVDLDFQGSATNTMLNLSPHGQLDGQTANHLFPPSRAVVPPFLETIVNVSGNKLDRSWLLPCTYDFASIESQRMVSWMLRELEYDPRYALARFLFSPTVKEKFDVVVIDAPPRMSLGAINGLTSARTLVIPTIADRMSSEAVENFIPQARDLSRVLNPALHTAMAVLNKASTTDLNDSERAIFQDLDDYLSNWHGYGAVMKTVVPRRASVTNATFEGSAAWFMRDKASPPIREIFTKIGDTIAGRIGLPVPDEL